MSEKKQPNWAGHCDTAVRFFATEEEAMAWALYELAICRHARSDGWDEDTTESIRVMRVTARAEKIDPNVHYVAVEYAIKPVAADWRLNHAVTPKMRSHYWFQHLGIIRRIYPESPNLEETMDVEIYHGDGETTILHEPTEEWMTA